MGIVQAGKSKIYIFSFGQTEHHVLGSKILGGGTSKSEASVL